jgi:hypothetical protein
MTPPTNRGVNFPDTAPIGLGWLSITFRAKTHTEGVFLTRRIAEAIGEPHPRERERGIQGYETAFDVLSSSAIGRTTDRPMEAHLTLKQSDCSWQRFAALVELADTCESWRVSRLDLNYDDAARTATPQAVQAAISAGHVVTRADRQNHAVARGGVISSVYVGSRASDRLLNVYDKDAERADALREPIAIGTYGVRWELRLKDARAIAAVAELRGLDDTGALVRFFWSLVRSLVDFRHAAEPGRTGHHYEVRPLLDWWRDLVDDAERRALYERRQPEDPNWRMWRKTRWLNTCAVAVAEVVEFQPDPLWLRELVRYGSEVLAERRARVTLQLAAV